MDHPESWFGASGRSPVNLCSARGFAYGHSWSGSLPWLGHPPFGSSRGRDPLSRGVDPGNDPQRRSGKAKERTLAAIAELKIVVIEQLSQFKSVRPAEISLKHSSSIWSLPICWNYSTSFAWLSLLSLLLLTRVNSSLAQSKSYLFH